MLELADEDVIPGKIDNDSGSVSVTVCYQALLFRPFKNEVMDAIVSVCNENGFFAKVGPLQIFVSRYVSCDDFAARLLRVGDVTRGKLAVWQQNMPDDFKFDSQRGDAFVSREEEEEIEIRENCVVRLRIMGVQVEASEIVRGRWLLYVTAKRFCE